MTGKPAVCLATLRPAATSLAKGVADATLDHVPLLAVPGQADLARLWRESHQMIDLAALFDPITKQSRTILTPAAIASAVAEALRVATAPRNGAVHLSLPEDIATASAEGTPLPAPPSATREIAARAIDASASRIREARRPVLVGSAGVLRGDACDAQRDFVERLSVPHATIFMAMGLLPYGHSPFPGTFGQPKPNYVDETIGSADLILSVGFDPVEFPPRDLTSCGDIPVISIADIEMPRDAGCRIADELVGICRKACPRLPMRLRDTGVGLSPGLWSPRPLTVAT